MGKCNSTIEEAIAICERKNYKILTNSISNCDEKIKYICNLHPEHGEQITSLWGLRNYKNNCRWCKMPKGKNHHNWKGGISSDREKFKIKTEYREWRKAVLKRDNLTCQCCGKQGGRLNVHHIKNYSDYPELRTDVDNGITLCESCHSVNIPGSFHSMYTQFNNTKEQLDEYIFNYQNRYDEIIQPFIDTYVPIKKQKKQPLGTKVYKYDLDGNYICEYLSMAQAARECGSLNASHISQCCNFERKLAFGFQWRTYATNKIEKYRYINSNRKSVLQYTLTGEFLKEYDSVMEAGDQFNKHAFKHISGCCLGEQKTAYGYKWRYKL